MRFEYSISEFIQGEWIVVIFIVAGFKFELLVFCLAVSHQTNITKQPFNLNAQCHEDYFRSFCVQSDNVQFYSLKCAVGNLTNGPFAKLPTAHFSE